MRTTLPSLGRVGGDLGPMSAPQLVRLLVDLLRARAGAAALEPLARARALEAAEHARRTVDFYAEAYGERAFHDLSDVPVVDKAAMRRYPFDELLAATPPPRSLTQRTSGTTGVPFEAVFSPRFAQWQGLLRMRTDLERRTWPWWRRAQLQFGAGDQRPKGAVLRWLQRRRLFLPLDGDARELATRIAEFRPATLAGHPSRLLDIGVELPDGVRLRRLITHGETVDSTLRHALTRTYGRAPLDSYGLSEVGAVAAQCRAGDLYHVQIESVVVEVVDDDDVPVEPGGTGSVIVTGLQNCLMPIVRYRVHDRVTTADRPCACGYRGPALARIVGRSSDFAVGAAGERISPEVLWLYNHLSPDLIARHVRRYQVHQVADGQIRVRLELREPLPDAVVDDALGSFRAVAHGQPVVLSVEDDLGDATPGKFRLVRSDVAAAHVGPTSA